MGDDKKKNTYWVNYESGELASKLVSKIENFQAITQVKNLYGQYSRAYQYYYGMDISGTHATSQVLRGGDQGELAEMRVNHSRSLVNTLLNLIVAPKLTWVPKAVNTDYEVIQETELASSLLEYYWADRQVSQITTRALEDALVFSEGFVMLGWDAESGDDYAAGPMMASPTPMVPSGGPAVDLQNPEGVAVSAPPATPQADVFTPGVMTRTGDVCLNKVCVWDIIRDPTKSSWSDLDWVIVRQYHNKFNLAAQYPDAEDLVHSASDDRLQAFSRNSSSSLYDSDDIACYYFFHKRTAAVPEGKEVVFLGNRGVLLDRPLTYETIPLYRVSAGEMSGTPFGYTPYFEVLGVQELMDSLHTAIATNQSTLATQCISVASGSTFAVDELGKGMRIIYHPPGEKAPEALQLTKTPQEVFMHLGNLKKDQELLFGLNSVVRGEPQSGELSGSALALLQSQALQQSSTIQANYLRFVEDVGSSILSIIRKNLSVERQVSIAGKSNQFLVRDQKYSGDSISNIKKVLVEIGNPMAQTTAGKTEMAKDLLQMGVIKSPEQYQQVLTTGRLEPLTQSLNNELLLIRAENEAMARGEQQPVLAIDDHMLHAREHRAVLANPEYRSRPEVASAVLNHIDEHDMMYHTVPPSTLVLMGQQPPPIPLIQGQGQGPMGPQGGAPPPSDQSGPPPGPPADSGAVMKPAGNPGEGQAKMPSMPQNPSTGHPWDPVTGGR